MRHAGGFCKFDRREEFKFDAKFGKLEFSSKFSRQNRDEFEADKFKRARCGI